MSLKKILVCLDADPQPSVFDGVVAVDSGVDFSVSPWRRRRRDRCATLCYGAMFTRGPQELKNTAVFIGGSDVTAAEALLKAAAETFFGPDAGVGDARRQRGEHDGSGGGAAAAAACAAARGDRDGAGGDRAPSAGGSCWLLASERRGCGSRPES